MKLVILESPFKASNLFSQDEHIRYARAALRASCYLGEAPMASHLLYPQALDDDNQIERQMGIEAGLAWRYASEGTVVYQDYGISAGMRYGIELAESLGKPVIYRSLEGWPK